MKTNKPRWRNVFVALLLMIAGALVWRFLPRERLLLKRATRVTSDRPYYVGKPPIYASYDPYFWKSPHEALLFHLTMSVPPNCSVELYDTATGRRRAMPSFSRIFQQSAVSNMAIVQIFFGRGAASNARRILGITLRNACSISPDGAWMLYRNWAGGANNPFRTLTLSLNGSRRIVWPAWSETRFDMIRQPFWLPDSRHWAEIVYDHTSHTFLAAVYGLDGKHYTGVIARGRWLWSGEVHGITQSGSVLIRKFNTPALPKRLVQIMEWDLQGILAHRANGSAHARTISIRMPANTEEVSGPDPRISPQGDRLAWVLTLENAHPEPAWLQRLWALFGQRQRKTFGLWVSHLDGSQLREIGHINYQPDDEVPQDIRWTPDGKRLSFLYKGALYTVPVDEGR
ncbi:MAG TPA: hypothetical protein VFA07_00610 [Chthonomonadaceae bacterium]|nr:hypothetical protein [Chthonomonadaceae bacterium]